MAHPFEQLPAARLLLAPDPAAVAAGPEALEAFDGVRVTRGGREHAAAAMRARLFDAGFLPLLHAVPGDESLDYLRAGLITDPATVGIIADDVVSMTDLGHRGRFGNQLFQYVFLKLYGLRNQARIESSAWSGEQIFGLSEARATPNRYPGIEFEGYQDDDLVLWQQDAPPLNVNFSGYFQELPPAFARHRYYLRRLLSLRPQWQAWLDGALTAPRESDQTLVAVHVRRGDVERRDQEMPRMLVPLDWTLSWLREVWPSLSNPVLHVATDGGEAVLAHFSDYPQLVLPPAPPDMPDVLPDFCVMRAASVLAITNSSFSRMAALLAEDHQRCFAPLPEQAGFAPYAPWDDRAFWRRLLPPGAEGDAMRLDDMRTRALKLRSELGRARHQSPGGRLMESEASAPAPCKACGAPAPLFGVCDFESWGNAARPPAGRPVYYRRCDACGLVFTTLFDGWTGTELQQAVYNDGFIAADPGFVLERPAARARHLASLFPGRAALSVLDYGALNYATVQTLEAEGFAAMARFDYFDATERAVGPADIVSCFDLLERMPMPDELAADLIARLKPDGVIVFTGAMLQEGATSLAVAAPAPRAGQVALYTPQTLAQLWSRHGLKTAPLGEGWHMAFRALPDFARHLAPR